jgi:hypothetical protein
MLVVEGLPRRRSGREGRRKRDMPTYITLMNWTDQGVRAARETVHRRERHRHHNRSPRRRERHRYALGARLAGQPQDHYPSRLRPRTDVRDHPKTRLRSPSATVGRGLGSSGPPSCPLFTNVVEWVFSEVRLPHSPGCPGMYPPSCPLLCTHKTLALRRSWPVRTGAMGTSSARSWDHHALPKGSRCAP